MPTLKEPQKQIPGGFQFYVPQTKWQPTPFSSLDSITQQLIAHRKGRPDLVAQNNWSLDPAIVYQEVLAYQVAVCVRNNWNDYLLGGSEVTVPFSEPIRPTLFHKARNVVAGEEAVVTWLIEGAPVVSQELANKRAATCTGGDDPSKACPMNGKGGLERYFTIPVVNAIRKQIERKKQMKLETPMDEMLGVCEACTCPLVLKPWMPLENILKNLLPEQAAALAPQCWIRRRDA